MPIIDLTRPFDQIEVRRHSVSLAVNNVLYTGIVYDYKFDSMQSTYIDFPGHVLETDNSERADNIPAAALYRLDADVIHLNFQDGAGAVGADDLVKHAPPVSNAPALIINALGTKNPRDIVERSVFLDRSALRWIIGRNYRLVVSDVYECRNLLGVFQMLFAAGIYTVCEPVNLFEINAARVKLTVLPCPVPDATQVPCRALVEY